MFRSTTPRLVPRPTGRPGGAWLVEPGLVEPGLIEPGLGNGLTTPLRAAVVAALRRGLTIALALAATFSVQSGLAAASRPAPARDFG